MKGGVRKRGNTWYYYFDLGYVDGKRKKIERTAEGAQTKAEAEAVLRRKILEYENAGTVFKPSEMTLHDAQITIKSAKLVNPQQYAEAEKGKVLAVEFECVNTGGSDLYIGTEEFKVSTPDGEQHEEYFGFDDGFINENVGAGKKITKKMYFDVPQSDKYEMIYSPTFTLSSKTLTFEITPK